MKRCWQFPLSIVTAIVALTLDQSEAADKHTLRIGTSQTHQASATIAYMTLACRLIKKLGGRLEEDILKQAVHGAPVAVNTDGGKSSVYVKETGILTMACVLDNGNVQRDFITNKADQPPPQTLRGRESARQSGGSWGAQKSPPRLCARLRGHAAQRILQRNPVEDSRRLRRAYASDYILPRFTKSRIIIARLGPAYDL